MAEISAIEWTDSTWNPVTGCDKVSPGCKHCYALTFAERWRGTSGHPFEQGFDLRLWPDRLRMPLEWKKPRRIFVNSMSDLFHQDIPDEFIEKVFQTMSYADHHVFQILTKRPERLLDWALDRYTNGRTGDGKQRWPKNVWIGVSVEMQLYASRIDLLRKVPTPNRFISFEPLLGKIKLPKSKLRGIRWAIVGGESGWKARPMLPAWVQLLKDSCDDAGVAFFFKQWGTFNADGERVGKKKSGRLYNGREWNEAPGVFQTVSA